MPLMALTDPDSYAETETVPDLVGEFFVAAAAIVDAFFFFLSILGKERDLTLRTGGEKIDSEQRWRA